MKLGLNIIGILAAFVGLVWFLQGIGVVQGSVMSDQSEWVVIGLIVMVGGVGLLVYNNRRQITDEN